MPGRSNIDRILQLFADTGTKATFFTLGWIAERYPANGPAHRRRMAMNSRPTALPITAPTTIAPAVSGRRDAGQRHAGRHRRHAVKGYRATSFSITRRNLWALNALEEAGYRYSSSTFPIQHDLYGIPEQPRFAFYPFPDSDFVEIPVTTMRRFGRNWPAAAAAISGCSLRLVQAQSEDGSRRRPPALHVLFSSLGNRSGSAADPGTSLKTRVRHYLNLDRTYGRLQTASEGFSLVQRRSGVLRRSRVMTMTRKACFCATACPIPPTRATRSAPMPCSAIWRSAGRCIWPVLSTRPTICNIWTRCGELAGGDCYFEPMGRRQRLAQPDGLASGKPLTTACFGSDRLQAWVNRSLTGLAIRRRRGVRLGDGALSARAPTPSRVLFDMVDIDSDKWRQYAARSRGAPQMALRTRGATSCRRWNARPPRPLAVLCWLRISRPTPSATSRRPAPPRSRADQWRRPGQILAGGVRKSFPARRTAHRHDRAHGLSAQP